MGSKTALQCSDRSPTSPKSPKRAPQTQHSTSTTSSSATFPHHLASRRRPALLTCTSHTLKTTREPAAAHRNNPQSALVFGQLIRYHSLSLLVKSLSSALPLPTLFYPRRYNDHHVPFDPQYLRFQYLRFDLSFVLSLTQEYLRGHICDLWLQLP